MIAHGYHTTLGPMIQRALAQYKDNIAVIHERGRITYQQFGTRINKVANALLSLGAQPGDRIAILMHNCPEFLEVELALLVSGMVRVGLNARLHPKEHAYIINDCGASLLVIGEEFAEHIATIRGELPHVKQVVCVGRGGLDLVDYETLLAGCAADEVHIPTEPDAPAFILYTSGTTGRPKGAVLSHRNWIACMRNLMVEIPTIHQTDVMLHVAPLTHASGLQVIPHLVRGATNLTVKAFDLQTLLATIERERVTIAFLVPTLINLLTAYPQVQQYDLSSLQTIIYAGSPIAGEKLRQAIQVFGKVFVQVYGLSEASMPISCLRKDDHLVDGNAQQRARLASAGRPSPFIEVRLANLDGQTVAAGEMGEIWVRGENVMNGYWNLPEATNAMIDAEGWAHTGDLGRMDDAGYLYLIDRKGDMIISGGLNVYPREIEEVIYTHPAVLEAAVIGVPDQKWGEAVKAVVVRKEGATTTAEEIIQLCRNNLAGYKKPQSVDFVDNLPKNAAGKILKKVLREPYWAGYERRVHG